jgi:hypothetical protein
LLSLFIAPAKTVDGGPRRLELSWHNVGDGVNKNARMPSRKAVRRAVHRVRQCDFRSIVQSNIKRRQEGSRRVFAGSGETET